MVLAIGGWTETFMNSLHSGSVELMGFLVLAIWLLCWMLEVRGLVR